MFPSRRLLQTAFLIAVVSLITVGKVAAKRTVNVPLSAITLTDTQNHPTTLSGIVTANSRATVLLFVGSGCPICNKNAPKIAALADKYAGKGVTFVLVYPNPGETCKSVAAHGKAYRLTGWKAVLDNRQELTRALDAKVTPQAFILTGANRQTIAYSGRIDDGFAARGVGKTTAAQDDLRLALDAVLAGKSPLVAKTTPVGCLIETSSAAKVASNIPTFAHDVAPIINTNCLNCHRDGESAPMPLANYVQVKKWASNIAQVTQTRFMPPWKPVAEHGDFVGARRLTDTQIAVLKNWADNGAPLGDPNAVPAAPKFVKGWQLGTPDLILSMPKAWHIEPGTGDLYRCFVIPTNLTEDKDVIGIEYRAGNKRVVHHLIGYVDTHGAARKLDGADGKPGYTSFGGPGFLPSGEVGGWAPGIQGSFLPDGIARRLPAHSDIVMQVHYNPSGKPEEDISSVGLFFARKPVKKYLRIFPVVAKLDIPAGSDSYSTEGGVPVPFDAHAIFILPHMHLLGKTIQMDLHLPDGTVKPMIRIDDWDFNWQGIYTYKEQVPLPKGSRITLAATYDNSEKNPRNPSHPPRVVGWGEKTTDEMCIGFIGYIADDDNDPVAKMLSGRRASR